MPVQRQGREAVHAEADGDVLGLLGLWAGVARAHGLMDVVALVLQQPQVETRLLPCVTQAWT